MNNQKIVEEIKKKLKEKNLEDEVNIENIRVNDDKARYEVKHKILLELPSMEGYLAIYDKRKEKRIREMLKEISLPPKVEVDVSFDTKRRVKKEEWGFQLLGIPEFRVDDKLIEEFKEKFKTGEKPVVWFPNHTYKEVEDWLTKKGNQSHYPLKYQHLQK